MAGERIDALRRRAVVGTAGLLAAALDAAGHVRAEPPRVNAHGGPILPPVAIPDVALTLADGTRTRSTTLLVGKATALQLIYTRCTTTCPMQGAIFQRVQHGLIEQTQHGVQLLSLSIDPAQDSSLALRQWLATFDAKPGWIAAAPAVPDLARLQDFLGYAPNSLAAHATEVQIIDRRGRLVWRTNELPAPESVCSLLRKV